MNKNEYWQSANKTTNAFYKYVHEELQKWKIKNNITERCIVHHRDDNDEVRAYNEAHYEQWGMNEDGTFTEGKYVQFLTCADHTKYHSTGEKNGMYGKHHSDEVRKKLSEVNSGKTLTEETRQKISESSKGKVISEDTRQRISESLKGIPKSEEHKQNLSRSRIENKTAVGEKNPMYGKGYLLTGEKNGMYGKHHSAETCSKISKALQGKSKPLTTGDKNGMHHITPEANARRKDKISDTMHKQMTALRFLYNHYKENGGQLNWNNFRSAIKTGDITFA